MALQGNTDLEIAALCDKAAHAVGSIADDDGGRAAQAPAPVRVVSPSAAVPNTQMPRAFRSRIVATRFATRATGIYSSAPASLADDGRQADAAAAGMMTPCAPAHSAVRMIAPRLCGSDSSSQMTSRGASPFSCAAFSISSTVA